MMQRQRKLGRTVAPCKTCAGQPKLYEVGRGKDRPPLLFLECAPCRIQTQRCASLDAIVAAWDAGHANEPPKPASYIRGLPAKGQR